MKSAKSIKVTKLGEVTANKFVEAVLENATHCAPVIGNYLISCLVSALKSFTEFVEAKAKYSLSKE